MLGDSDHPKYTLPEKSGEGKKKVLEALLLEIAKRGPRQCVKPAMRALNSLFSRRRTVFRDGEKLVILVDVESQTVRRFCFVVAAFVMVQGPMSDGRCKLHMYHTENTLPKCTLRKISHPIDADCTYMGDVQGKVSRRGISIRGYFYVLIVRLSIVQNQNSDLALHLTLKARVCYTRNYGALSYALP